MLLEGEVPVGAALSAADFLCTGTFPSVTVVPGGGLKVNWAASGREKSTALNATSNTGSATVLANTWTRSGTCSVPSMATRTWATNEFASFGFSTSSYADRSATFAMPLVVTSVLGVIAASARSAAA